MDRAPPSSRKSYLIGIGVRGDFDPARHASAPPAALPPQPPGLLQPLDGVADCPLAAAGMEGERLVGGEAGTRSFVGEAESQLAPYQLVNCGEFSSGNPVSPQCVQHQGN